MSCDIPLTLGTNNLEHQNWQIDQIPSKYQEINIETLFIKINTAIKQQKKREKGISVREGMKR